MKVEVLVATMNQQDFSLIKKMNLHSDVVIANQSDTYDYQEELSDNFSYKMITTAQRGVGKNRNTALLYSTGDILIFADDDVLYMDNYADIIANAFQKNKRADVIMFNLTEESGRKMIKKHHKVGFFNAMRYGAVRIAVRKESLDKSNIWFSTLYGGGAKYSCGEDSLFIRECLKKGLKIYAIPDVIAGLLNDRESTWNTGDLQKQAYDKGIWLKNAYPKLCYLLKYMFAYKMKKLEFSYRKTLKQIKKGIKDFK